MYVKKCEKIVKMYIYFFKFVYKKMLFNNLINFDKLIFYFFKINDILWYFFYNSVVYCLKLYMYIMNLSCGLMINVICIVMYCIVWLFCYLEVECYSEYVWEKLGDILLFVVVDVVVVCFEDFIDFLVYWLYIIRVSI